MVKRITKINKKNALIIHKVMLSELQDIFAEYGLEITMNGGKLFSTELECNLGFKLRVTGSKDEIQKKNFMQYASMFNLKAQDYGKQYEWGGATFELVGLKPQAPKNCILGKMVSDRKGNTKSAQVGKTFHMAREAIASLIPKLDTQKIGGSISSTPKSAADKKKADDYVKDFLPTKKPMARTKTGGRSRKGIGAAI